MKKLDKWIDVRKKQVREAEDMIVTIVKDESLNSYNFKGIKKGFRTS